MEALAAAPSEAAEAAEVLAAVPLGAAEAAEALAAAPSGAAEAAEADAGKMRESDKKRHSPWGTVPLSCN